MKGINEYIDIPANQEPLKLGEIGVLQHLNRQALNGLIAEVTGELRTRMLYSLSNPADSEVCPAYKVLVPGYPADKRIEWCVKAHQLRRIGKIEQPEGFEQTQPFCILGR